MGNVTVFDKWEFARFGMAGGLAAIGNITSVWFARSYVNFEISLVIGIAIGLAVSFTLSKFFAFGSVSWRRAGGELFRFLIVYLASCAIYWLVAVVVSRAGVAYEIPTNLAQSCGILIGAGMMMLTSYFGHRFFTYQTHRRSN